MAMPTLVEAVDGRPGRYPSPTIEFYSIELSPMPGGQFHVGVSATLCEEDGELTRMDLGSERTASIDEALSAIRNALSSN